MLMFSPACVMVMIMMIIIMRLSLQVHGYRSCIESERKGLLELKAYLKNYEFPYDWPNDTNSDCCQWERVKCDLISGRVIGLFLTDIDAPPPLNLSLLYPFGQLHTLNLSYFWCREWFDDIHGYESLGRLKNLEILDLSGTGVNDSVLPFFNAASSLTTLILRENLITASFPMKELKNLRNLEVLDLSMNMFIGPLPGKGLADLHRLRALDLSNNVFSGSLRKEGLCQLKNLRALDLSKNQFTGPFPPCFDSLIQLEVLDISSNQFNGSLPSFMSNLSALEYLSLSDNVFEGIFSFDSIANLSKLKVFRLSSRSSLLHTDLEIPRQPRFQLSIIELQYCNLETVPIFLQQQKDLRLINLSNNKLTGAFPSWFLEQNLKLGVLLLQNNSFTMFQLPKLLNHSLKVLDVSTNEFGGRLPDNIGKVLPNLRHLNLSSNVFQGNFPSSSGNMNMLHFLDLSHNHLSGILPRKFLMGCYLLRILKLSHNRFSGLVFSEPANLKLLSFLKADHNQFIAVAAGLRRSNGLLTLDISNNYLQGVLPSWFGDFPFWYLSVSDNLLEGTIPTTIFNRSAITLLDLSRNKFSGNLPLYFNCKLMFLNDNEFSGAIPNTLLENVGVLDLRNNNLSGKIPSFVSNIFIKYLLLRDNRLTGHIPTDLCGLKSIRMLDLANNRLSGSIPSCLNNVSFGRNLSNDTDGYSEIFGLGLDNELGEYSGLLDLQLEFDPPYTSDMKFMFEFASKRRYDSYNERSLDFMFGMDLSNNELSGEIPGELGDLQRIRSLNLSHNSLSGQIPKSLSNLTDIESIDLSFNALRGPIPQDLGNLHYMVVFNVSYNNLSGSIPNQGRFSTLDETNYIGNPLLCGSAINKSCDDNNTIGFVEPDFQSGDDETTINMEIFYWSLGATYGVTWMTIIVFLCFDSPWRQAWFRLVDAFISCFKCV